MLIATGTGYQDCTAFDGFEIIAHPLPRREDRVYPGKDSPGFTYASHDLQIARRRDDDGKLSREIYILMEHGSGREVWKIRHFYDQQASQEALLALPERVLYALAYSIWAGMRDAREDAVKEEAAKWRRATLDKRVKVKRSARRGKALVWCQPERPEGMSDDHYKTLCAINAPSF